MGYDQVSRVYDAFNDGFDYRDYLDRIEPFLTGLPVEKLALDCGCGTGSLMLELFRRGYDCTGLDLSEGMLAAADEKLRAAGYEPHLICQDLGAINLYGAYHVVFSSLDTINHILDKRILTRFFRRLHCFVEPGGYFVFDLKRRASLAGRSVSVEERENELLILRRDFDGRYAEYRLDAFVLRADGGWERCSDQVTERFYPMKDLTALLRSFGFALVKRIRYYEREIAIFQKSESRKGAL